MKAIYIKEFGGTENLEIREVNDPPKPINKQVLVKVRAAALNRADLLQRNGLYPPPVGYPERIPGLEFAGNVADIGDNVEAVKIGDRVFGITAGGAQAEFLQTEESMLAKIPANLDFPEAAALPEAFITAYDAVFTQGKIKTGESLLIHAVGSGVGLAALQLARAHNIKSFGSSRTAEKLNKCAKFGLDVKILTNSKNGFVEVIKAETAGRGVDVILDLVGAGYFCENLESLAIKGRLVVVGLVSGRNAELDLGLALTKRITIIGTVLRSRSPEEKAAATGEFISNVLPLLETGKLEPNLDRVYEYQDVRAAHDYLESNESFGKVVLNFP